MIAVEDLVFGYKPNERIIDGLSFRFDAGDVSAVTGRSGCGKSTLMYLLGLLLTPWSGRILHDDMNAQLWRDRQRSRYRASRIGFVFQDAALDSTRTVLDNIIESSVYNQITRRRAVERAAMLMERFGVAIRADHKPGEVSGGQAQRIALCRALLARPNIVLADEPTGNLDTRTASMVLAALKETAHEDGRTVLIATHDPDIVSSCDRVLEL